MSYFTPEFNSFFKGLAANNNKEWFDENRKTYHKEVKDPFYRLVGDLIEEVKKINPFDLEVKDAVFRINNDIRFNPEKPIYKMHVGACIGKNGKKNYTSPELYLQLSPGESFIGSGVYMPDKINLEKIRKGIAENLEEFNSLKNDVDFVEAFGGFGDSKVNKIITKDLKSVAEKEPLIYNKQFYYWKQFDDGESFVLQENLLEIIMEYYHKAQPMNNFFRKFMNENP